MNEKPTKHTVDDVYTLQWIGWIITLLLVVGCAYAGVQLPSLPPMPIPAEGGTFRTQAYSHLSGMVVQAPTTFATATPAMIVNNLGLGKSFEVQDASTPVFSVNNGGSWSSTGAGTHSSGQTVDNWIAVAAPTTQPTGTPAAAIANAGVGALLNISGSALEYQFDTSALDLMSNYLEADINTEHLMLPSVASQAITYTAAAGGTINLFTIGDGEIWIVHDVFVHVTTNFDCTGDDCTLHIGDGNDADGLCDLDDGELQTTDVEVTGGPAGWQCFGGADTIGAYIASGRAHIYAPSGGAETIDAVLAATGDDFSAGAATVYIVYTRIQ